MATRTATTSGAWSSAGTWDTAPADDDSVVINANVAVLMDADLSAWTGLRTVTITSHATTPGMLYFKDGTSGHLKLRTGYNVVGTNAATKGRLLANSNGTWGATGALAFANKAVVDLQGTAKIDAQYLDIALYCTQPTTRFVRTYGTKFDFTASGSTVDTANNTIDLGTTPPSADTSVMFISAGGTLPAPLQTDRIYFVRAVSGNTIKLSSRPTFDYFIDLTSTGSGAVSMITGYASGSSTVNVVENVTGDAAWVTTDGHDFGALVDALIVTSDTAADVQRLQLTTINATSLVLSATVDSTQYAGARFVLLSRNVSLRTTYTLYSEPLVDYGSATHAGVFQCELRNGTAATSMYGLAIKNGGAEGAGHVFSGTMSGFYYALYGSGCVGATISGIVVMPPNSLGMYNLQSATVTSDGQLYAGTHQWMNSTIAGVAWGVVQVCGTSKDTIVTASCFGVNTIITASINCTWAGEAYGGITGISGTTHWTDTTAASVIAGFARGMQGPIVSRGNIGYDATGAAHLNEIDVVVASSCFVKHRGGKIPTPPACGGRNAGTTSYGYQQGIYLEDYGGVLGASLALVANGDILKQATTVRPGGAASALEVTPLSTTNARFPILVCEWTELAVPASAQNKSVFIRADAAWSGYPTAAQLYFEAEYISNATTFARTVNTSTAVLSDGSTWVEFETGSFAPAAAGHVRYRLWLKTYEASRKIYVDAQMQDT